MPRRRNISDLTVRGKASPIWAKTGQPPSNSNKTLASSQPRITRSAQTTRTQYSPVRETPRPASASAVILSHSSDQQEHNSDAESQDSGSENQNASLDLALDLSNLNASLNNFYKKNVSFVDNGVKQDLPQNKLLDGDSESTSSTEERLKQLIDSDDRENQFKPSLDLGSSISIEESLSDHSSSPITSMTGNENPWFLDPPHYSIRSEDNQRNHNNKSHSMSRSSSPAVSEYTGEINYKYLVLKYFPVTLGGLDLPKLNYSADNESAEPIVPPRKYDLSPSAVDRTWSYSPPAVTSSGYGTVTTDMAGFSSSTPFSDRLGELRMQQLKLEEAQMLKLKMIEELERIRGPKPRWY
ncbi:PREDICTED: uncharacterized protein LOC106814613 isoform X2 [Priapulus caudatus]|nr:PREDICTED: uncharacterized protein LOC106814613 isoform X2 [Priapulus caudatus]